MRWLCRVVSLSLVLAGGALGGSAIAAEPPEVAHFSGRETFGPQVITDLPCLEGTEFTATGGVSFRGTVVNSGSFFHFSGVNRFFATLVPVDGQGPTYVEGGNMEKNTFTARAVPAGVEINQTNIINDQFLGYLDGRLVTTATIRVHEVQHVVGLDTDGDDVPDTFKVSVSIDRVSCPAS